MTEDGTRERVLQAALTAFTEQGYEATTIADIRARSGISTGSIYHHYGSKEAVAAALYTDGIRSYQCGFTRTLLCARDGEAGVRQAIRFHFDWVSENPDWARFVLCQGRPEWLSPQADAVAEHNRGFRDAVESWLAERTAAGEIAALPPDVALALMIGAPQFLVRAWAAGRIAELPRNQAKTLADAAWRALRPEPAPQQTQKKAKTKRKVGA